MTTAAKRKGSKAELDLVKYLKENGWKYADRRLAGSSLDKGDISGVNGVVFEVKNQAKMDLAGWTGELVDEIRNASAEVGAVVHKRRGKADVGDWYATMPVYVFTMLLKRGGF
jgi:Holliday junction resolvase